MVTALTGLRHTETADTSWVLIYSSALSVFCSLCFSASSLSHTISKADPWIWLGIWSLPFSLMYISSCAVTQTISSASAPGTACCAHSCRKPFPAWYNPSTPPAQNHPGPPRRESFLSAWQGVRPWERLGAESHLRGRSGFTSKTWVTSSFKGGTVPWSQQFDHLSPGRLTRAASGICNQEKGTKMSNLTYSYLDWKIN